MTDNDRGDPVSGDDHNQGEKLQPSRADIYGDGWATAALGSMGGDPVVVSGDQLDLDAGVTEAARRLCRAAHRDDWPHDDAGPCAAHLTTAEVLTEPLVAEVRRLREWRKRLLDEGFGYDDSEESAAEVLEWAPIWRARELGTETTLKYALRLLDDMADTEDCWFDHHGGCQAHGVLDLEQGEVCPHQAARTLLRSVSVT